ncbi:MAG: 30S ribosomal protein S1 [Candidatus Puniceispirillum sp.]|nr:30S ribosomal protein S1 [Candidatus Pelagibacter sp.]MBA4283385.1 30S ribosomal protein S1 [Candidatus Puniceispirillum sp.]
MNQLTNSLLNTTSTESFSSLLEEFMGDSVSLEGKIVKGTVVSIYNNFAVLDVGMKSEGRVPLKELSPRGIESDVKIGDQIDVYIERLEDKNGEAVLSVEKAKREAAWMELETAQKEGTLINGIIFGKVKGGFAVDLNGAIAFLPGSQVDIRPIRDITPLMNIAQPFKLLKMDKQRSNIVVSRRAVLEETRAEARTEIVSQLEENQVMEGMVKNITDYGAFIDLGGVDGLLHVTDISWRRINHPGDVLKVGDSVKVVIIRFNKETQRISLGMKQLEEDPWKGKEDLFQIGSKLKGTITSITDYGAFVELQGNVEGLIYVTEMSWIKKNVHPSKIVEVGQEVDVVILEVDSTKRRISLGLKQCTENPWKEFLDKHPVGSVIEGSIKNITEFGLFVGVTDMLDGMIHLSDLAWDSNTDDLIKQFSKGMNIQVKVLDVDPDKERISLGIKQLTENKFDKADQNFKKGDSVTGTVSVIGDKFIEVSLEDGIVGIIKKADLSRDRDLQRPDRFAVGEKVDSKVLNLDKSSNKVNLSIKALEVEEEKKVLAEYGSSDSGASLGDILGAAMKKKSDQ